MEISGTRIDSPHGQQAINWSGVHAFNLPNNNEVTIKTFIDETVSHPGGQLRRPGFTFSDKSQFVVRILQ